MKTILCVATGTFEMYGYYSVNQFIFASRTISVTWCSPSRVLNTDITPHSNCIYVLGVMKKKKKKLQAS